MPIGHLAIWIVTAISIALMMVRPRGIAEVWWISAGALVLVAARLVSLPMAGHSILEGIDVYLFLGGMMLLSELAQHHGVFDWLAALAIRYARGSKARLFALIYACGTVVTIFLSNDATAVVLTPAVLAAVKRSKAEPLPYLFICAFIANAASFVLPVSNPANLVVFRGGMPALGSWLAMFLLASVLSIAVTFAMLRWVCRKDLQGNFDGAAGEVALTFAGRLTIGGLVLVSIVLLVASARGWDLGLPTFAAAAVVVGVVSLQSKSNPWTLVKEISWSVLPLVAGLFILVGAVNSVGALHLATASLRSLERFAPVIGAMAGAFAVGVGTNLINNLPLGLIAGASVQAAHVTGALRNAVLIGIDLGPNLSVTGSLATILWLIAIRKEGLNVSAWKFLKVGALVMPPALALATVAAMLFRH